MSQRAFIDLFPQPPSALLRALGGLLQGSCPPRAYGQHMLDMRAYTSHAAPVSRHNSQESAAVRRVPTPQEWGNVPELVTDECLKLDRRPLRMSL
jgi:hypothetical protein